MARKRAKDLTTDSNWRYGPWKPMRGARGEAEAQMLEARSPWHTSQPQAPLVPGRNQVLSQGADMTSYRRRSNWRPG